MTKVYDFKNGYSWEEISEIRDTILNDGIVVVPTETVYGLGASIYSDKALNKIFIAKGRPNDNPLIVHVCSREMIKDITISIDELSFELMNRFCPGPLTVILPKNNVSDIITAGLDTVGVRMPDNEIFLRIIEESGVPIAAPSANLSGKPSGTNIADIKEELFGSVDAIIDAGSTQIGLESTVVRVVDEKVRILRPGAITRRHIESLGIKVAENIRENDKFASPGTRYKHYAPEAKTVLVYSDDNQTAINKINEIIAENNEKKVIVISFDENQKEFNSESLSLGSKVNLSEVANNLFTVLRKSDKLNPDLIIIEGTDIHNLGEAIMNRLTKAASDSHILKYKRKT